MVMNNRHTLIWLLLCTGFSRAGIVVDIVPTPLSDPPEAPPFHFTGDADVIVDVFLRQDTVSSDIFINYLQFDLMNSLPFHTISLSVTEDDPEIHFWDLTASSCGTFCYTVDDDLSGDQPGIISLEWVLGDEFRDFQLTIPGDGSQLHIGSLEYFVPADYGVGVLDLLNYNNTDFTNGFELRYGIDPEITLRLDSGEISEGFIEFQVAIPEPSSFILLLIGCNIFARSKCRGY